MKKLLITIVILMVGLNLASQTPQTNLNQAELFKQFIGNWHYGNKPDTVQGWELRQAGNIMIQTNYNIINNSKSISFIFSYKYDPDLDKFKLFGMSPDGNNEIYLSSFVSDKKAVYERVDNLKNKKVLRRNEVLIESPGVLFFTSYNADGIKTAEMKVTRTDLKAPELNQLELSKKLIGVWQRDGKKDTIPGMEFEQYGNTIIASDILIINGKKAAHDKISYGFSKSQNMFKIFFLSPSGGYSTRNAYFTSENRFFQEFVQDFNPEKLGGTAEFIFDSPTKMTARIIDLNGRIRSEGTLTKVK